MEIENKFLGFICIAFLFVVLTAAILNLTGCNDTYSEGERTGTVIKISNKGVFRKTWEGQMNLGGMIPVKDGAAVNTWDFTIDDLSVLEKVQAACKSGKPISVSYHQWLVTPGFSSDSGYMIIKVNDTKEGKQ